ncbi:MAG: FecR family protein [Myxococcota bacterium]
MTSPSDDALWDRSGHDPELAELEGLLGVYAHRAPLRSPPARPRRVWWMAGAGALLAVAAAIALVVVRPSSEREAAGFAVRLVSLDAGAAGGAGEASRLAVGDWLETSAEVRAEIAVADIGSITLSPDSRLRLVRTGPSEHRLELARGALSAKVDAPPRLFVVDVPGAAAVDLGCAYAMEVEPDGATHLLVTTGSVSLEGHGRAAWVPRGHEVWARPGGGPGLPLALGASPALRAAAAALDRDGAAGAAEGVRAAGPGDAVTLWNLLARTAGATRLEVAARLDQIAARPSWVLDDAVARGDAEALDGWRDAIEVRLSVRP